MSSLLKGVCICRRDISRLSFVWGSQAVRILQLDILLPGVRKIRQRQSMSKELVVPEGGSKVKV